MLAESTHTSPTPISSMVAPNPCTVGGEVEEQLEEEEEQLEEEEEELEEEEEMEEEGDPSGVYGPLVRPVGLAALLTHGQGHSLGPQHLVQVQVQVQGWILQKKIAE